MLFSASNIYDIIIRYCTSKNEPEDKSYILQKNYVPHVFTHKYDDCVLN